MPTNSQAARLAALALVALLSGCHKKVRVATPPLPPLTIPAPPMPLPAPPPELPAPTPSTVPPESAPAPTPAPATRTAPRRSASRPAPTPAAPKPTPEAPSIGTLSEGGSPESGSREQAQALIADIDKRLQALSTDIRQQQSKPLAQVQLFLKQARDALSSGDPAGANNLATKSKLLLDDLLK